MTHMSDELALRLESALRDMPSINHGPLDKGDYSRAVKRLALAIHDTTAALRASIPGGVGVDRLEDCERNKIINQASTDLESIIKGHDPDISILANDVWDRLDKMAVAIERRILSALDLSPAEGQVRISKELTDIIAALPPSASGKPHLTFYATPSNPVVSDGEEEHRIEDLRFKAFRTNDPDDRQAYFDAVSKWFQDRHYRAISVKPQSGEEE